MATLFIQLYLDEDVDVLVAELIRARGLHVLTTQEAGRAGQDDESQLDYAAQQGRSILTHNRADFEELNRHYVPAGRRHAGIIIAVQRPPYEITLRLLRLLNALTAAEMENQIVYI